MRDGEISPEMAHLFRAPSACLSSPVIITAVHCLALILRFLTNDRKRLASLGTQKTLVLPPATKVERPRRPIPAPTISLIRAPRPPGAVPFLVSMETRNRKRIPQ